MARGGNTPARAGMKKGRNVRASLQHETAQRALSVIAREAKAGRTLSYTQLAFELDYTALHARAMAQVCDLLDSAATLAGRPLMAFATVRDATGEINPKAWVKDTIPGLREMLIAEAKTHVFSAADEVGIRDALGRLEGYGNRRAWKYVRGIVSQEDMLARLKDRKRPPELDSLKDDSINDLGTDEPPVSNTTGRRYVRDPAVRAAVVARAGGACEFCGTRGFKCMDGSPYLESHHIIALANEGEDRLTNVIALCPGHHREAHFGKSRVEMERKMMAIVRRKTGKRG